MRLFICALAVSTVAFAGAAGGPAEFNPVRAHPRAQAQATVHRLIVKLRAAGVASATSARAQAVSPHDRIADLAARAGLTMNGSHAITDRLHALQVGPAQAGDSIAATIARLRADPEVEYAEPDQRRYAHAVPDDTLYHGSGPLASGQWYLQNNPTVSPAGVNAEAAWDVSKGDPNLVIADLDTGVRFDHPDLKSAAAGGRLLPGFDFVSEVAIANDGDGRDADASDPGDWVTAAEAQQAPFKGASCIPDGQDHVDSSWHGTRTAGILGALTNDALGIAGMTWSGKILPVRVLGKCGGLDSDIIAGMLWAAGIHEAGVPDNANPAKIINMSLGATGACPQSYADTIAQVAARGVLVVVSAGNEGGPVDAPANCAGAAGIAGIRQVGTKVGFSSLGPEIAVSAPAGNCVNTTLTPATPCEYSIQTTTNSGTMGPDANGNGYTDEVNNPNLGTSFAAPIASGIAALMASVNSHLSSCQLIARLKEGSQAFPQSSPGESPQPPACHVPASSTDLQNAECLCTVDGKTCGAGMANAAGAVAAALRPIAVVTLPATVAAGQSVALNAQGSVAANGHTISTYQWTNAGAQTVAIQNGMTPTPIVTAPSCGLATVQLAVTDNAGREDTAEVVLSPASATSTAPTSAAATSCASPSVVMLAVCPASSSVQAGSGTQSFTASVANTSDASVTWQVNGVVGGNATVGTISTAGVYMAPGKLPSPSTVTVTAVSAADQAVTSSTQVTITAPPSSHGGGGGIDLFTLLANALALSTGRLSRRYTSRRAASSQDLCALR
ncbi:MAG: S8 family serine peptidase [Steroidobacteraceae bacterium]